LSKLGPLETEQEFAFDDRKRKPTPQSGNPKKLKVIVPVRHPKFATNLIN
jgi:hypothetical protein